MHTINFKTKATKSTLVVLTLIFFTAIMIKYQKPVDIERACKEASPSLANQINSCSLVDHALKHLKSNGYDPVLIENTRQSGRLLRAKFHLQIFEIDNYRINDDQIIGTAQLSFINGRLSSITFFPTSTDSIFNLYPENSSKAITVRHATNYQGKRYISWPNNYLEAYITWWISRYP